MNKRILVIEDDKAIGRLICDNLRFDGFDVEWCEIGQEVVSSVARFLPNLILLDLMLPNGIDGFQLCRTLTERPQHVPLIIVTARGQKEDRIRGLTLGADDYVVKPFALEELLARIHAVLRRTEPGLEHLQLGTIEIDFRRLRAFNQGKELSLTDREFQILRYLAEHAGSVVSRDDLLRVVWGYADVPVTRTVDNFIFRLRHLIEPDPHHPRYIRKAYGDGYRLTIDEEPEE
jgi:DNA-binding response OmpR family regulator